MQRQNTASFGDPPPTPREQRASQQASQDTEKEKKVAAAYRLMRLPSIRAGVYALAKQLQADPRNDDDLVALIDLYRKSARPGR